MNRKNSKGVLVLIVVSFWLVMGCTGFITLISNEEDYKFNREKLETLDIDWTAQGEAITFPARVFFPSEEVYTLEGVLPDDIEDHEALYYRGNSCGQQVLIDGEEVYSASFNKNVPLGRMRGNVSVLVPMKAEYAGKRITINMYNPYMNNLPSVFAGVYRSTEGQVMFEIFKSEAWKLVIFFAYLVGAIFMFAYGVIHLRVDKNSRISQTFGFFSFFTMSIAGWAMADSEIMQFYTNQRTAVEFLSFNLLVLMGVSYMGLCDKLFYKRTRFFVVMEQIGCVLLVLFVGLYILNIMDPSDHLWLIYLYGAVCLIGSVVVFIKNVRKMFFAKFLIMGSAILLLGAIISVYGFNADPINSDASKPLLIALTIYITILFTMLLHYETVVLRNSAEKTIYQELAYKDQLTGISNRAAFERDIDEIEAEHMSERIILFMGDLNGLKRINDEEGHGKGDQCIKAAADCMKEIFGEEYGVYRLGGDEFAAIVVGDRKPVEYYYQQIENIIKSMNKKSEFEISIAISHAEKPDTTSRIDIRNELYREADANMYKRKKEMKSEQPRS